MSSPYRRTLTGCRAHANEERSQSTGRRTSNNTTLYSMRAEVFTRLERNERGRLRIKSVRVALYPELDDPSKIDRCKDIFEDFCIVSQSVREGIPVEMELVPPSQNVS